ncbi:L-aspartate oxidase [uncultured archaeon]|nr:L-aspartate oxidase [uncultured archaeon]
MKIMPEKFDLIVVGSGIAGLSAALEAAKSKGKSICLIDRFDESHSNSFCAQGGIACAFAKNDSWQKHAQDTLAAGAGLCNNEIVNLVTKKGPEAIKELMDSGLEFDGGNAKPEFGLEGGHSEKRVLHIKGDQTGKEVTKFMARLAKEQGNIQIIGKAFMAGIAAGNNGFIGIEAIGKADAISGNALVIATGGYAACFEKSTNPETTLGSGIAVAEQAGCILGGMEFVQFHPTTLQSAIGSNFLVSEAVRGEGGKIVDGNNRAIVNPLWTRDKVSIAIYEELAAGGKVFLDAREVRADFAERFPSIYAELLRHKINPETDLIPIEAAAHYTIGGIKTNERAMASIKGIYAAGECSCSGLHGANRLASNSLLEGLVMGKIAGANAISEKSGKQSPTKPNLKISPEKGGLSQAIALKQMRQAMWANCGIVRETAKMESGLAKIKMLEKEIEVSETIENAVARNALLVSRRTFEAALARKGSVGCHCRIN